MPNDILRDGGEAAVARALAWLTNRSPDALEHHVLPGVRAAAFNITILSQLLGTALQPDLADPAMMLAEVSEHLYRIDRSLFHITGHPPTPQRKSARTGKSGSI